MIKISVACVGRIKEKYLTEGLREYEKRLSGYCRFAWMEVQDERTAENATAAEEELIRKEEEIADDEIINDESIKEAT